MKAYLLFLVLFLAHSVSSNTLHKAKHNIAADGDKRVVCYYGSWAVYRPDLGKFDVENIDPFVCTHVIYAFAGLNAATYEIMSLDTYNDLYDNYGKGAFNRFADLATINPDLKCMLGIGGWNEDPVKYSNMANDPAKRATFVASVAPFLKTYGFHGLDLDWEYPDERGGIVADKEAYSALLQELKASFEADGYILSIAVSAGKDTIDAAYNVPEIVPSVDFINVMAYDYHGSWEPFTGENAPLDARPGETDAEQLFNVDYSINYWLSLGAPASLLNMGIPTYGHNFALADPTVTDFYSTTYGPGDAGPYTRQAGTLGYNEICVDLQDGGWTVVLDQYYQAPYAYKGNQWIGYDDPDSIATKCQLANDLGLGGVMIWSIETDDFQPTCGPTPFPLLGVINEYMRGGAPTRGPTPPPPTTTPYTGPPTTQKPTTPPTSPYTFPPPDPTDVCQHEGFQADPNDCTTFYNCIPTPYGTWSVYEFHCGAGTVFDPAIDSCNYPENVPDCHADI